MKRQFTPTRLPKFSFKVRHRDSISHASLLQPIALLLSNLPESHKFFVHLSQITNT